MEPARSPPADAPLPACYGGTWLWPIGSAGAAPWQVFTGRWACSDAEAADIAARVRVELAKNLYL